MQHHGKAATLPASEAFRIEYWALEEAKIRREPPEKDLSRRVVMVVGGGSGIGREVALIAAERGAHIVAADRDEKSAETVATEARKIAGSEAVIWVSVDIRDRRSIRSALDRAVRQFGGIDILVNTAAIFPSSPDGMINDALWALTLEVNVTGNHLLTDEAREILAKGIDGKRDPLEDEPFLSGGEFDVALSSIAAELHCYLADGADDRQNDSRRKTRFAGCFS